MLQEVWRESVSCGFQRVLLLGKSGEPCVAVGDVRGQLQFFYLSQQSGRLACRSRESLDTKGGPIQAMAKREGSRTACSDAESVGSGPGKGRETTDLVVADSQGNVSVFFVGTWIELLARHTLRCAASAVCLDREAGTWKG